MPTTLLDVPREIALEISSHLDPFCEEELRAAVSLWELGLISTSDFGDMYLPCDRPPDWSGRILNTISKHTEGWFQIWLDRCLDVAVNAGCLDLVDTLVGRGANLDHDHLIQAASCGLNDAIDHLARHHGMDPNAMSPHGSWCPLYAACLAGHAGTIKHLIEEYDVDYRARTSSGYTVLNLAARDKACLALLETFLRNG